MIGPREPNKCMLFLYAIKFYWRSIIVVFWPLLCGLLFIIEDTPKIRCAYTILVMALFWITEALPLPVTSMIPIVAFPLFGIMTTENVSMQYFKETVMMFVAGLIVAIAVEHCNLHKRIALRVMLIIGFTHRRLTLGLMLCTMFVSMWVSNTAATAMMAPIAQAILEELEAQNLIRMYNVPKGEEVFPHPTRTTICYFLTIAYAATIGGTGTIVGTGTNLTFKGIFETKFPNAPPIDFGKWMAFNIPGMLVSTILTWAGLNWMFLGLFRKGGMDPEVKKQKKEDKEAAKETAAIVRKVIQTKYDEMSGMSFHEISVCVLFLFVVSLWVFREPGFVIGWAERLTDVKVKDATAGMFVSILFFALPSTLQFLHIFDKDPEKRPHKAGPALLSWKYVQLKMPWGLLFLLGGGFALAEGGQKSGLAAFIGQSLKGVEVMPNYLVMFLSAFIASTMTEFAANVAIANIILPVLAEMAIAIKMHPIYLMMPSALCCSFSFMLPVGTPPNAIVAGMANIRTKDMMLAGIAPTIITLLSIGVFFPTWGEVIYQANTFPDWAHASTV